MTLILDAGVIVILILTCIIGYVRGFKKYFVGIIASVIATAAAAYGSVTLAEPVYDRYMRDSVNSYVLSAAEDFDPINVVEEKLDEHGLGGYVTDEEIRGAMSRGGDYLENIGGLLEQNGVDSDSAESLRRNIGGYLGSEFPEVIRQKLDANGLSPYTGRVDISAEELREYVSRAASQGKSDAADYLVERAIKPVLVGVIRSLLFAVCFAAVMLLLQLIIFISGIANTSPELRAADRFAGLALGAVKGLLYCVVIAWVLSTLCSATSNSLEDFNADIAERTYLFRYFFDYFYR